VESGRRRSPKTKNQRPKIKNTNLNIKKLSRILISNLKCQNSNLPAGRQDYILKLKTKKIYRFDM